MGCDGYREALSARLDGEEVPGDQAAGLDAHLAECPACRRWLEDAAAITRRLRLGPAVAGPDVTEAVLPAAPGRWRSRLAVALRVVLAGVGVAQLVLGLLQVSVLRPVEPSGLHGGTVDGAAPGHLWHESAAWNIAIGVALLWVAARPGRPVGIVPILSVFIGALVLLSLSDLASGRVEGVRLASHAFVLTGYLLVLVLSRTQLDLTPPGQRARAGWGWPARSAGYRGPERVIRLGSPGQPAARTSRREAA